MLKVWNRNRSKYVGEDSFKQGTLWYIKQGNYELYLFISIYWANCKSFELRYESHVHLHKPRWLSLKPIFYPQMSILITPMTARKVRCNIRPTLSSKIFTETHLGQKATLANVAHRIFTEMQPYDLLLSIISYTNQVFPLQYGTKKCQLLASPVSDHGRL